MGLADLQEMGMVEEESGCMGRFCCQCWRPLKLKMMSNTNEVLFESESTLFALS
jgi:hypothetical protein